jgi:hypothetical protein
MGVERKLQREEKEERREGGKNWDFDRDCIEAMSIWEALPF